jgi:hypothetical protein
MLSDDELSSDEEGAEWPLELMALAKQWKPQVGQMGVLLHCMTTV